MSDRALDELGYYLLAGAGGEGPATLMDEARRGEELGFGTAFISERWNVKEASSLAGAACAVTNRMQIATAATNHNTRHPLITGSWATTMHRLSGGRFTLGIGRGIAAIYGAFGIPAVTTAQMEDWAQVMRRLFHGELIFNHDGPMGKYPILFLDPDNIANIVRAVSETGIIAIGMTFVIITAGIDLSVGAVLGLSSVVTATMMISGGFGLIPTILAVLIMGIVFGTIQGTISSRFRLEPFIVTLAGLQAARGLALVVSGNQYINISYGDGPGLAPPVFAILGERLFNNTVPVATIVFIVFAAIATIVLNTTRFGRYVFAVGGNERAARISGVPVSMVKISVYAITGFAAALAGIVHAGQFNFGSANDGMGYELTAIAAVVIGGTSLFGGAGSMVGTVAGTIMLGALANILQLNNITPALQLLATAAIIVLAAVLQSLVRRREGLGR